MKFNCFLNKRLYREGRAKITRSRLQLKKKKEMLQMTKLKKILITFN